MLESGDYGRRAAQCLGTCQQLKSKFGQGLMVEAKMQTANTTVLETGAGAANSNLALGTPPSGTYTE